MARFWEEKAWILVEQRPARIFETAPPFSLEATLIEDLTPAQKKSAFIWAVFQLRGVVEEPIQVGFKGRPAVVKQMSLFMVTKWVDWIRRKLLETVGNHLSDK